MASLRRRSVLGGSDDLILPRSSLALSLPLLGGGQYWGGSDDLILPSISLALSWPLLVGGQYWKFLMIYPYLALHMPSLGLSVEEVSTGRF